MSDDRRRPRSGPAALLLRLLSALVPSRHRDAWLESWRAELWHLDRLRRTRENRSLPSPATLTLGAARHSLWLRKESIMALSTRELPAAVRILSRRPGFAAVAVVTMALGIGANTVVFSMANALLLRAPLSIAAPDRLVQIGRDRPDRGFDNLAYPYVAVLEQAASLDGVGAYSAELLRVGRTGDRQLLPAELVSGGYFEVLGVEPELGRLLAPSDADRGASPVAVISAATWNNRFGGDPGVVGRRLQIGTGEHTIVGVAPAGFGGIDVIGRPAALWIPISSAPSALGPEYGSGPGRFDGWGMSWLWVVGRMADSATVATVDAEIDPLYTAAYESRWGQAPTSTLGVLPGVGLRPSERSAVASLLAVLALIVGLVLAVACANLTNLLLARGLDRTRELAIRTALGASRPRIVLQLVTENVVLGTAGGIAAFIVAVFSARLVPALLPVSTRVAFRPDATVFAFALGVGLVSGILVAIVPSLRSSRQGPASAMREGESLQGRTGGWLRNGLVAGQLALSFALLAGSGLLVRSLIEGRAADPGYATQDVITMTVSLGPAGYTPETTGPFWSRLQQRAAGLPGVRAVTLASRRPFAGWSRRGVFHPDPSQVPEDRPLEPDSAVVGHDFFATLGIPLLSGGGFDVAGADAAPAPVIVSRSLARMLWPQRDAVGELLPLSRERAPDESLRVVGVVADVQFRSLQEPPRPSIYVSAAHSPPLTGTLYVRAEGDPAALGRPLRRLAADLEPAAAILDVVTLSGAMGRSLQETRLVARLAVTFGLLAITLAAVGLYGLIHYVTSSREREVGLRMALGARSADVLSLFVRQALALVGLGLVAGTALTAAGGGVLSGLLYGVSALDPPTLILIAGGIALVSVGAAMVPALRAARTDPATTLRGD